MITRVSIVLAAVIWALAGPVSAYAQIPGQQFESLVQKIRQGGNPHEAVIALRPPAIHLLAWSEIARFVYVQQASVLAAEIYATRDLSVDAEQEVRAWPKFDAKALGGAAIIRGTEPAAVTDPVIRAAYEKAVAEHRAAMKVISREQRKLQEGDFCTHAGQSVISYRWHVSVYGKGMRNYLSGLAYPSWIKDRLIRNILPWPQRFDLDAEGRNTGERFEIKSKESLEDTRYDLVLHDGGVDRILWTKVVQKINGQVPEDWANLVDAERNDEGMLVFIEANESMATVLQFDSNGKMLIDLKLNDPGWLRIARLNGIVMVQAPDKVLAKLDNGRVVTSTVAGGTLVDEAGLDIGGIDDAVFDQVSLFRQGKPYTAMTSVLTYVDDQVCWDIVTRLINPDSSREVEAQAIADLEKLNSKSSTHYLTWVISSAAADNDIGRLDIRLNTATPPLAAAALKKRGAKVVPCLMQSLCNLIPESGEMDVYQKRSTELIGETACAVAPVDEAMETLEEVGLEIGASQKISTAREIVAKWYEAHTPKN